MQKPISQISKKQKVLILEALYTSVDKADSSGSLRHFIDHVLTESERIVVGRRLAVAQLILQGETYNSINEQLHISPNSYRNIRAWLYDQIPEYGKIVHAVSTNTTKTNKTKKQDPLTFAGMSQKYPLHFLLFNATKSTLNKTEN